MNPRIANLRHALGKTLRPYVVALTAVVALGARAILHPFLHTEETSTFMAYTTFMVATAFSAWFLGLGPSLFAIGLGLLVSDFFFVPPVHSFSAFSRNELPETITYLVDISGFQRPPVWEESI
jgi:K+-sensing histidine kinase KdpD